jgi:hypothetical protein
MNCVFVEPEKYPVHLEDNTQHCGRVAVVALPASRKVREAFTKLIEVVSEPVGPSRSKPQFNAGGYCISVVNKACSVVDATHTEGSGATTVVCASFQFGRERALARDDPTFSEISESSLDRGVTFYASHIVGHRRYVVGEGNRHLIEGLL